MYKLELFLRYTQTGTWNWGTGCLPIYCETCKTREPSAHVFCHGEETALQWKKMQHADREEWTWLGHQIPAFPLPVLSIWYIHVSVELAVSSSDLNKFNLAIFQLHPKKSQHISLIYNERNHWQNLLVYYYQQIACDMSQNGLWYC